MDRPILHVEDGDLADQRFQDGALPHVAGVKSYQILRANRAHPEWADGFGWTYNHAAMLAYAYGRFFCEYLSNPVDEHEVPGHTMLCVSRDGAHWDKPVVAFPEVEVPTAQYRGPRSPLLGETALTVPHQRMGFYYATNGVLLVLSFYGIVHDRHASMPCDGWGVGRAVRRILPDGTLARDIYFLIYNEPAGYTAENTPVFAPYAASDDAAFVAACDELLQNGAVVRQMYEEQRFDARLFPTPGAEALSFYTAADGEMIGVYKKSLVSVSRDGGRTWTEPTFQPSIQTASGKVWGQRTSDGRYALLYNPTADGQHRWPIAAVTGEDGRAFSHMAAVTGEMGPQRYGGIDKNLGPQYMRGIAECNPQTPDGDIWLVYSNNKEDIWVSRIPVPLEASGPLCGALERWDALPPSLGAYSPAWARVEARDGALRLCDREPYDAARVEVSIGEAASGRVELELEIEKLCDSCALTLDMQDASGRTPIRLVFRPDGTLFVRADGRTDPWTPYETGAPLALSVEFDNVQRRYTVELNGAKKTFSYSASVRALARLSLRTKERIPCLCTLDSVGKYGRKEQVLPGCEEPTEESALRVRAIRWACSAARA